MIGKLRILPLVIVTAVLLFGIKLVDIRRNIVDLGVKPALAETKKEAAGKPVTALAEKNQDGAAAGTRANGENSAEVDKQTTDTAAATDPTAPLPKAKKSITMSIFEASNFQDITGQRITKALGALNHIEQKVEVLAAIVAGAEIPESEETAESDVPSDADLLNGPAMPDAANSQEDIDALLASFD